MKRIVLLSIFAYALGVVSLHAMEQEFPVKGKKVGEEKVAQASDEVYIYWGTITNETGRLLKDITFTSGIGSENKFTVTQLRPNETAKIFKGPFPIGDAAGNPITTLKGEVHASFAQQRIEIPGQPMPLGLTISLVPYSSAIYTIYARLFRGRPDYEEKLEKIDLNKKVNIQVNIILRDSPDGRAFAGSEVELHAMQ